MRKIQLVTMMGICALTLAACGSDAAVTVEETAATSESVVAETASSEAVVSPAGKRSNPLVNGQTASFDLTYYDDAYEPIDGNASITVSNPVRGQAAFDALIAQNQFNEPAPEGMEWLIFDVNLVLNEGSVDYSFNSSNIYFKVIGSDGSEVDQSTWGTLDDSFGSNDLYVGGSDWGQEAMLVPAGDTGVLIEANGFSTPSVFFNLN